MQEQKMCKDCGIGLAGAAGGANFCEDCVVDKLEGAALDLERAEDGRRCEHRCEFCGVNGVALGVMFCAYCNAASVEAWGRAYEAPTGGRLALPTREEMGAMIWRRDEVARRVASLDKIILTVADRVRPAAVTAQEYVDSLRGPVEQRQRGGAALEALETARPVEAGAALVPPRLTCPDCGGSGEWQGNTHTKMFGGYSCLTCEGTGEIANPDPDAGSCVKVASPALNVEPLERRLAALDGPEEGETWGAFHARAAAEIIGHYTGADGADDTRAELREAIDHIVKAADEAAAERGAATVRRVEELLAAHHREIGAELDVMKRGAVVEAMKILNTATGAAAAALTRGPEDPAVD